MKCHFCQHDIQPDFKFCPNCSQPLKTRATDEYLLVAFRSLAEGNVKKAVGQLQEIMKQEPSNLVALKTLGNAYFHEGKLDEAIHAYRDVLEIDPNYKDVLYDIGVAHYYRGNLNDSAQFFRNLLRIDR